MTRPGGYGTSMHWPYCRDGDCTGCLPPAPPLHHERCASLLGQGCDCRDPWSDPEPRTIAGMADAEQKALRARYLYDAEFHAAVHRYAQRTRGSATWTSDDELLADARVVARQPLLGQPEESAQ